MFKTMIFGILLAGLSTPSIAEPATESRKVIIADLDLASASGKARLTQRIADACGEASNVDIEGRNDVRQCRADAKLSAKRLMASREPAGEVMRIARAGE